VPTNSSAPVQVTFNATNFQPGTYTTTLSIYNNDPFHSPVQVPVTMTVLPTPSMGWVEGTVSDLRTADPMVAAISAAGQPYTVTSSLPDGRYRLWLEPGAYELHVSAPGYVAQTQMIDIQTQQGATQDFALLLDAPWLHYAPDSLTATQMAGAIITRELAITNSGTIALDYFISAGNKGVSFNTASTELYGYAVPGAWLKVIGLADDTQVEVIDLATGQSIISGTVNINRYEVSDFYPYEGTHYKVRATKPVVAYASDFNGYGHLTFIPSILGGPVGKEFIFYFHCGDTIGDYCYVFAIEDAQVEVYDPSGALVASRQLQAGEFWQLGMPNGVYRIVSTGNIDIEISAEDSYSSVPSVDGDSSGYQFYFATHFQESGAFAVFAYQDAQINVYDLETGSLLYTHTLNRGEYWWQTDVYLKKLRLESTGVVEVWAGATEGGTGIENLGDDVSFTTGEGGRGFYTHSLMEGSIIFAPFDGTTVNIDGTIYGLNQDEYLDLSGCCYYRHITSSKPILVTTLGAGLGWGSSGTYLGGIVSREGGFPSWLSTSPLSGTLPGGQSQHNIVAFNASNLQPGIYSTTLELLSNDPLQPLVRAPVTMTVLGEGTWLVPEEQAKDGAPGSVVTYTVELYNFTPMTDSYALTLAGNAWPVSLPPTPIGPLEPGMHQDINVSVAVPPGAAWYASDTVVVTATSLISPTAYHDSTRLTTQAYAPAQISVLPSTLNSLQQPGQATTHTLTIGNGFGVTLTFTATVPGAAPWLEIEPDFGSVTTNGSTSIQVTLDSTGMQPSMYLTIIQIASNDPTRPLVHVPVMMLVLPQALVEVTLTGTESGLAGQPYTFTAEVIPNVTTLPILYTWQASGQAPLIHNGGSSDTATFTWSTPGTQVITVTASNASGSVVDTHTINIIDELISGLVASNDGPTILGSPTAFSAALATGTNAIFTWDFGDGTGGSGPVADHTYAEAGVYTATVTASNSVNQASASTTVMVIAADHHLYLPLISRQPGGAEIGSLESIVDRRDY
jgi:PKD repeat protein